MIETPLFESRILRLTEVDLEQDPVIEAAWTQDLDYARWFRQEPPRPLAPFEIKKYYQKLLKPDGEGSAVFHFAVRLKQDERLIGFVRVANIVWNNGVGSIEMAVGDPALHGRCEEEMLTLILKYAFHELNLFRLSLTVPEYDSVLQQACLAAGFMLEVRQRNTFYRHGRYADGMIYGLLYPEWEKQAEGVK